MYSHKLDYHVKPPRQLLTNGNPLLNRCDYVPSVPQNMVARDKVKIGRVNSIYKPQSQGGKTEVVP